MSAPSGPFSHARFLSPPHVFFLAFGAFACRGEPEAMLEHAWNDEFRELLREFPEELRDSQTLWRAEFFWYDLGGNAVGFFHIVFFVSGSASFVVFYRSSLLRVAVWKNFRERTFVFECSGWSCVFR